MVNTFHDEYEQDDAVGNPDPDAEPIDTTPDTNPNADEGEED